MSRATMAAASVTVPRASLYGIGSCRVGTEFRDFEIGWDEVDRDIEWMTALLREAGLKKGDLAQITLPNWEGPWFTPLIAGLKRIGVVVALAEQFSWDARRVAHFVGSLRPRAYFGLCAETLQGLRGLEIDTAELLSDVEIIWARHDALAETPNLGFSAQPLVPLGPALAVGVPGVGAVVNTGEWEIRTAEGEFVVSTASDRAMRFTDVGTGIKGTVGKQTELGTTVEFEF
ncbi:hypothetical protein [Mycobacterium paraseoulense]|uniref:AMP-dependent synthetase/ligase domain-containing protein n=1 Tax=Mycobacterium paraseoulense TaxID=590652 RepID=A0A1X0IEY9_9MYCO|nr:hypothetical protein [Mycobacterium paraseoulense]MCV7393842.1 hypothetical protein [Mycobacterium paraseoulense]ORB45430.1 hypothetical protein BST39_04190 [Mycobacterium paraseoulense]